MKRQIEKQLKYIEEFGIELSLKERGFIKGELRLSYLNGKADGIKVCQKILKTK